MVVWLRWNSTTGGPPLIIMSPRSSRSTSHQGASEFQTWDGFNQTSAQIRPHWRGVCRIRAGHLDQLFDNHDRVWTLKPIRPNFLRLPAARVGRQPRPRGQQSGGHSVEGRKGDPKKTQQTRDRRAQGRRGTQEDRGRRRRRVRLRRSTTRGDHLCVASRTSAS